MLIQENVLLAPYTTFKIGGPARYFCVAENQADALEAFGFAEKNNLKTFILGGGSNILVSDKGFDGLVIKVDNKGIEILSQDENSVLLNIASGEVWDDAVKFAVEGGWWGIENLSHIPGSTGAIAVQNVGAYGQEASRVIESVDVFNTQTRAAENIKNTDCKFGYRKSIFNSEQKGKYIIFDVVLKLSKILKPELGYRDLKKLFEGKSPSLEEIRQAVTGIRDKKFPFPVEAKLGNAGSFFKNPTLSGDDYQNLLSKIGQEFGKEATNDLEKKKFVDNGQIKVPAAFLIELCGLKNLEFGGAAINPNQPLVIVNSSGTATAADVLNLAGKVKRDVFSKTGVGLRFEPELIGF